MTLLQIGMAAKAGFAKTRGAQRRFCKNGWRAVTGLQRKMAACSAFAKPCAFLLLQIRHSPPWNAPNPANGRWAGRKTASNDGFAKRNGAQRHFCKSRRRGGAQRRFCNWEIAHESILAFPKCRFGLSPCFFAFGLCLLWAPAGSPASTPCPFAFADWGAIAFGEAARIRGREAHGQRPANRNQRLAARTNVSRPAARNQRLAASRVAPLMIRRIAGTRNDNDTGGKQGEKPACARVSQQGGPS